MAESDKDKEIEALKEEVWELRTILNKMPGNLYWKSKDDRYLGCNENVAKILNLSSPEEVIGKSGAEIIPPELLNKIRESDEKIITAQKEMAMEELGIDVLGNPVIYSSRKSPFYDRHGNLIGLMGVSVDITYQKKIEEKLKIAKTEAEAADKAKSRLLAVLSHELRTPLTSLLGFATFLKQENLSSEEKEGYLEYIIGSGTYLLTLVNNIMDFSKLDMERLQLVPAPINLNKLLEHVNAMMQSVAREKNLTLQSKYDESLPETILADGQALRQILINLVGNALKFTQKGGVTIKVKCAERTHDAVKVLIMVEDTGIGIPKDNIKDIFKEFYQTEDVYTRQSSMAGAGLGLAIVKKLAILMNGKITVSSNVGKGSVFTFIASFPVASSTLINKKNINREIMNRFAHLKVLLVEDSPLVQEVHRKMLAHLGCNVDVADTGTQALGLASDVYDVIFVDIGLPDFDGVELIKAIRKKSSYLRDVFIVALTGFFTDEEKGRCLTAGANEFLVKPVTEELLQQILVEMM